MGRGGNWVKYHTWLINFYVFRYLGEGVFSAILISFEGQLDSIEVDFGPCGQSGTGIGHIESLQILHYASILCSIVPLRRRILYIGAGA